MVQREEYTGLPADWRTKVHSCAEKKFQSIVYYRIAHTVL